MTSHGWLPEARPAMTSAYPGACAEIAEIAQRADTDSQSFIRPLTVCDLAECRGMCCYDGVYLDVDEPERLQRVVDDHRVLLDEIGLDLPDEVVVDGDWKGKASGAKTAVRPFPFSDLVDRYPSHFEDTACVFHLLDGRCGLQVLAVRLGEHPWHFKPTGCWLHPIQLLQGSPPVVRLPSRETDPYRFDEYDGYVSRTRCGEEVDSGEPAYQLLEAELETIGRLGGHDLLDEVRVFVRRTSP